MSLSKVSGGGTKRLETQRAASTPTSSKSPSSFRVGFTAETTSHRPHLIISIDLSVLIRCQRVLDSTPATSTRPVLCGGVAFVGAHNVGVRHAPTPCFKAENCIVPTAVTCHHVIAPREGSSDVGLATATVIWREWPSPVVTRGFR